MYRESVARLGALVFLSALGFLGVGLGLIGAIAGASPTVAGLSTPALLTSTPTCTPAWGIVPGPNTTHAAD